jgi:exosortase
MILGALLIPIPERIFHHFFDHFFHPLQLIATKLAVVLLGVVSVPVSLNGDLIGVGELGLYVPDCCSGIRSLLTLVMLVIAYACLRETRLWVRVLLACSAVPVAVAADTSRIFGTGLLATYWDLNKAGRFFHVYSGWVIFLLELITLFILHRVIVFFWPDSPTTKVS